MEELDNVTEALKELQEDPAVPRNVKIHIEKTIEILGEESDITIKTSKALHELEEISDDNNVEAYTRQQLWNIVSLLEGLSVNGKKKKSK